MEYFVIHDEQLGIIEMLAWVISEDEETIALSGMRKNLDQSYYNIRCYFKVDIIERNKMIVI